MIRYVNRSSSVRYCFRLTDPHASNPRRRDRVLSVRLRVSRWVEPALATRSSRRTRSCHSPSSPTPSSLGSEPTSPRSSGPTPQASSG